MYKDDNRRGKSGNYQGGYQNDYRDRNDRREYQDYYRGREYSEYDDSEIRDEIDRLRGEILELKRALEARKAENIDVKTAIKASEQVNVELLSALSQKLDGVTSRLDSVETDINTTIKKLPNTLRDELEDMNLPIEAKCEAIDERIKELRADLDYSDTINQLGETVSTKVDAALNEKFGSKTIGTVLQKMSTLSAFVITNMIGTIMLLALMCYFIVSLI